MAYRPINPPAVGWSLTLAHDQWTRLSTHLFSGPGEHGAVLLAGTAPGSRGPRLLGRELLLAIDGKDYVPGKYGHRALSAAFVRDAALRAREHELAYLAVHNHRDLDHVGFSKVDMASHERGYPALRQLTGQTVGGLVLTPHAAAGDLWLPDGSRATLAEVVIPTVNLLRLRATPAAATEGSGEGRYDRQARLFGDLGQETLRRLRVAVVGLGGVGSIMVELLARLGVGHLILIEPDTVDEEGTNLPRLIAAEPTDVGKPKTMLAARNAHRANSNIKVTIINERVEHPDAQEELTKSDWIFLAADGPAARHFTTVIGNQFLIPITQAGVKIPVNPANGDVGQIHVATRLLLPGQGCLWCGGFINPTELAIDLHTTQERQAARYVSEAPAPSVIALNTLAAGEAVNQFTLAATNLHEECIDDLGWILHRPRTRERDFVLARQDPDCRFCSPNGVLGRGSATTSREAA